MKDNIKEEIVECEENLIQAFRESDLTVIDEMIHTDLLFNGPNGELIDKEMDLETYRSGNMIVDIMEAEGREINVFGNVAVVSTVIYLKGSFLKHPIDSKARFLRVWKKDDTQWKVIGGSSVILS